MRPGDKVDTKPRCARGVYTTNMDRAAERSDKEDGERRRRGWVSGTAIAAGAITALNALAALGFALSEVHTYGETCRHDNNDGLRLEDLVFFFALAAIPSLITYAMVRTRSLVVTILAVFVALGFCALTFVGIAVYAVGQAMSCWH